MRRLFALAWFLAFVLAIPVGCTRGKRSVSPQQVLEVPSDSGELLKEDQTRFKVTSVNGKGPYARRFEISLGVPVKEISLVQVMPLAPGDLHPYLIKPNELSRGFEFDYGKPQVVIPKVEVKLKNGELLLFEERVRIADIESRPRSKILYFGRGDPLDYGQMSAAYDGEPLRLSYLHPASAEEEQQLLMQYSKSYDYHPELYRTDQNDPLVPIDLKDYVSEDSWLNPVLGFHEMRMDLDISGDGREVVFNHVMDKRRLPEDNKPFNKQYPYLAYRTTDLYIVETDGDNLRRITNSETIKERPNFSPDGFYVLYTEEDPLRGKGRRQLKLLDLATMETTVLTDGTYDDFRGVFSSDGKEIIYSSNDGRRVRLKVITPKGEHLRTYDLPMDAYDPAFSPDGREIAFVGPNESLKWWDLTWRKPLWGLYILSKDGTQLETVGEYWFIRDGGYLDADFTDMFPSSARKPAFSADGKRVYFIGSIARPNFYPADLDQGSGGAWLRGTLFAYDRTFTRIYQVTTPFLRPAYLQFSWSDWGGIDAFALSPSPFYIGR